MLARLEVLSFVIVITATIFKYRSTGLMHKSENGVCQHPMFCWDPLFNEKNLQFIILVLIYTLSCSFLHTDVNLPVGANSPYLKATRIKKKIALLDWCINQKSGDVNTPGSAGTLSLMQKSDGK